MMTLAMASYWAWYAHAWWMLLGVGIPMGICLGLKDHNRGVWCSLVALGASICPLVFGYITLPWFVIYCGGNYLLGWITNNKMKLVQKKEDWVTGVGFGLITL
jgi:hypothetical protein